jgi:type 2 lantibiotic biosynthesis protein LanM
VGRKVYWAGRGPGFKTIHQRARPSRNPQDLVKVTKRESGTVDISPAAMIARTRRSSTIFNLFGSSSMTSLSRHDTVEEQDKSWRQAVLTEEDLLHITERAATLYERLDSQGVLSEDPNTEALIEERLERWCKTAAAGDWQALNRRLAGDGFDVETVRSHLTNESAGQAKRFPEWLLTVAEVVAFVGCSAVCKADHRQFGAGYRTLPFEELFIPIVEFAKGRLHSVTGTNSRLLSAQACTTLEYTLLQMLAFYLSQSVYLEFCVYRAKRQSSLHRLISRVERDASDHLYKEFIAHMFRAGLNEFFKEYCFLARQTATIINDWVSAVAEFLERFSLDRPALSETFSQGQEPGHITGISPWLSDPHKGERTVMIVTFASGLRLVYKPKSLDLEESLSELLRWFNGNGAPLDLKALRVLRRGQYGWAEFAEHLACRDQPEAKRFFERMGILACIVYALRGRDFHYQNIVASGEYPVLVDAETLLYPDIAYEAETKDESGAYRQAEKLLMNSVYRTGILPWWLPAPEGANFDVSGLGGFDPLDRFYREPEWKKINTDRMELGYTLSRFRETSNLPFLDDRTLDPDEFVEDFCAGFRQMYRFFEDKRERIFSSECPFSRLSGERTRVLVRPTPVYSSLFCKTLHPDFCRSGIDWGIQWDMLSQLHVKAPCKQRFQRILRAEHESASHLDVPYFTAFSDRTDVELENGEVIADCLRMPGYAASVSLIESLCEDDLQRQLGIIRSAFHARIAGKTGNSLRREGEFVLTNLDREPLTDEEMLSEAIGIARGLQERAICSPDGSATWIGSEFDFRSRHHELRPLEYTMYGGTSGVALFLFAVDACAGDLAFRDLALAAIRGLRHQIRKDGKALPTNQSLGGISGVASLVYALLRISDFAQSDAILEDASLTASLITEERIGGDHNLDIISGAAGSLIALLALHDRTRDRSLIAKAIKCGEHLLNMRRPSPCGPRAWPTLNGRLLTGFSHGAAGISYALIKLYRATGDTQFFDAGVEGMEYERSVYSEEAGNWPDLRETAASAEWLFASSWCHGAPGIGLARIGTLEIMDSPKIREEVDIALKAAGRHSLRGVDHLCCGISGVVDFLLEAGCRLFRPELVASARRQLSSLVRRSKENHGFCLFENVPGAFVYNPGLFQGVAGIGYELLRCASAGRFPPSVLLME